MSEKKALSLLALCLSLSCVFSACTSAFSYPPSSTESSPASATSSAQIPASSDLKDQIVIKFGHNYSLDHPVELTAQMMKKELSEKSNGRIVLESYPSAQLGASRELMTGIMNNTVEMCVTSTFGTVEPRILTVEMPYLFKDFEHVKKFLSSEYSTELLALLDKQNVHAIDFWGVGFRNIGNTKREVKTPAELKGLVIRAFENQMLTDTLSALGANVTVLPVGEVYVGLQTGTIDGEENPYLNTYTMKFYEVAKYKTESRHLFNFDVVAFSKTFWDSLTPEDQALISEVVHEGTLYYTDLVEQSDVKYRALLEDNGVKITQITDYAPWIDAVQPVYSKWQQQLGQETIDKIRALGW